MKAGNFLALEATRQLRGAGILRRLPLRFLLTSDEESGSPSTRGLIEHTAAGSKYVLVPEGAQPNGNLVSGRFPTTRFRLRTSGKPAHALLQRAEGRSALAAMAGLIARIEAMNSADCSFTVTYFKSGHRVATVPMHGDAEVICTARSQEALDGALEALKNLAHENSDTVLDVDIKTARPTWVPGPGDHAMWNLARTLSEAIGIALDRETLFGGSDGNFTGAMGIPTLDGLGPIGADAHQITENIDIASLVPRGRLLAGLIALLE
jgi:glutamate carboxypeptidase